MRNQLSLRPLVLRLRKSLKLPSENIILFYLGSRRELRKSKLSKVWRARRAMHKKRLWFNQELSPQIGPFRSRCHQSCLLWRTGASRRWRHPGGVGRTSQGPKKWGTRPDLGKAESSRTEPHRVPWPKVLTSLCRTMTPWHWIQQ